MNKNRQTQRRIFRAFRRAYLTGRMARYLQCKYYKQAERAYKGYCKEFMVATEEERRDFETERNRLQAIGRREVIGGITGITRA